MNPRRVARQNPIKKSGKKHDSAIDGGAPGGGGGGIGADERGAVALVSILGIRG